MELRARMSTLKSGDAAATAIWARGLHGSTAIRWPPTDQALATRGPNRAGGSA